MFLYVETLLTSAPALSLANTCVGFPVQYQHRCNNTAEPVRVDGHDNTAANRLHVSLASNCVRDKLFSPARYSSGHQEPAR